MPAGSVSVAPTTGTPDALASFSMRTAIGSEAWLLYTSSRACRVLRSVSKAATSEALGSVLFMTARWKASLRTRIPRAANRAPNTGSVAVTGVPASRARRAAILAWTGRSERWKPARRCW